MPSNAIRQSEMNRLVIFLSAPDKELVLGSYTLVDKTAPDYARYVKDYPVLAKEPIYVRKDLDQAQIDKLNPVMAKSILVVNTLEQAMADPAKAAAMAKGSPVDPSKLPPGTDLFTALGKLPAAQLAQMTTAMNDKFASLGSSMTNQMAIAAVKAEYAALGVDAAKMQRNYILQMGGMMLLISLFGGACMIASGFLAARTATAWRATSARPCSKRSKAFPAPSSTNSPPLRSSRARPTT